jgi:Zn-dependent M16 (insulinase) family peptidase
MDIEERLDFLDRQYLSHYTAQPIDSAIEPVAPFTEPQYIEKQYPVMEGEDTTDATYLTYNVSLGVGTDAQSYIAYQVLNYALCTAPGAPLKQKLLDQRIGKEVYSVMEVGIYQPYFSVVAKDTAPEKQDEFVRTIETVLKEVADHGLDKRTLAAAINYYEFRYLEADFGSYPKGLIIGLQAMDSWLYDDSAIFMHIEAKATYAALKAAIGTGYYEELIRRYIIDNTHKSIMRVVPVPGLTAQKETQLFDELQGYKATLTAAEIDLIIKRAEDLELYQEEPSPLEALKTIPMLTRADIKKEAVDFVNEERRAGAIPVLFHDIFTNGIGYLRFIFDIKKVPEELFGYIGIFKSVLGMVDTEQYSYAELNNEINIETGGIQSVVNTYMNANDRSQYKATLEIKVKVLYQNLSKAFLLAGEVVSHSRYRDSKRLYEIIAELKSKTETAMAGSGHSVATMRAMSYISETAAIADRLNGIPQYRLLAELEAHYDEKKEELFHKLEQLATYIFRADNLMVDYTATAAEYAGIDELVGEFSKNLFTTPISETQYVSRLVKRNEGFMTAGQVQYVARAGNFTTKGLPYTGSLKVLKVMMGYEYLWTQVRVKGGAYGCMCSITKSGDSYFVSYRDPNLAKTVEIYQQAADFIKNYQSDERSITQFVIGAISDLDIPMTPATKGAYSLSGYMTNMSFEAVQRERDELLATTQEGLRGLYRYVEAFMADECFCVVGNEDKIRESKALFMEIVPLFK